jgi:hypothetical protein
VGFVRKLRSSVLLAFVAGAGPAACLADPMSPCEAFEPGTGATNTVVRAFEGPIAAMAMKDAFVLINVCDGPAGECRVQKVLLEHLSPGSQVMLTTDGQWLVGIDHEDGAVWTHEIIGTEVTAESFVHENGPAQLVIGLRDSDHLIVRDRGDRLAVYSPEGRVAVPIAPELGEYQRLAAVGERHVAVRVPREGGVQSLYVVDVIDAPKDYHPVATGDFTSVVLGPGDGTLVVSEGRGAGASVLVFDVASRELVDAFAGDLVSSREQNDHRALEEVPGLHALSPTGEQLAYRTVAGSLAVRHMGEQSSCLVRNTNRMGTGEEPSRRAGDHAIAGFAADGMVFAEYTVGASDSFVYAYDPRNQQLAPLGAEDGGWHLAAVPGRVTDEHGDPERLWAVGVRGGSHASIGEDRVDGKTVGRELTFMPMDDDGVWAIDTKDEIVGERRSERALSVRRVAPPAWNDGELRFEQGPDEQVVTYTQQGGDGDNEGPLRVPLTGRLCLTTGAPGSWAYRCGDSTGTRDAITTNSGQQEQTNDPNVRPEFDPPFPDQGDGEPVDGDDESEKDHGPTRD